MSNQSYYKEITNKFDKLTKREYASFSLSGIQLAVIVSIITFVTFTILEALGHFSSAIRTVMFVCFLLVSAGAFAYYFIYPFGKYLNLLKREDYFTVAEKVGLFFPFIKDDLLNVMQLVTIKNNNRMYSESLVNAAFQQVYLKTKSVNFEDAVNFKKSKSLLRYLIAIILFITILFVFIPGLQAASYRIFNFNTTFIPPAKFTFEIHPGNASATKGENILITAKILGNRPNNVNFALKYKEETDYTEKELTPDSSGLYKFEIPAVRGSFNYYLTAENVQSEIFHIDVVDKPIIRNLDLTITPPAYSRLQTIKQIDNGNLTSLIGSKVNLSISSTKPMGKAYLQFNDSTQVNLNINSNHANGTFSVKKDQDYKIIIFDKERTQNENPVTYSIKALIDAYPSIEMLQPNKDILLGMDNRLPVEVKVGDDFGFSKLLLRYRITSLNGEDNGSEYQSVELPLSKNLREEDINYIWNLSTLNITPKDGVSYYLEVFDNDYISGPKSAKTANYMVSVPSMDELFATVDKAQTSTENKLSETLDEAAKLKDKLENISRDLKKDKKDITWQEKEEIQKSLQKFDELSKKVNDAQKDLAKMQNQLQQNNLLSKETLEKYMELQNLFKEMSSEDMQKAMERMQQMLQDMNRDQVQKAMEDFKFNEEQFKNSIERTLKLLKRASIEQKLDEILKRVENLNNKLEELQKQTNNSKLNNNNEKQDLAEKQKDVTDDLKNLSDNMKDLQDKMNEFKDMPNRQMQQTAEEFENQKNDEMSEKTEQELMQGMKQQSQQNQASLSKNMQKMRQNMKQMQSQMQQQNQKMVFNDMMRILDDLLTLSKEQENLKNQSQNMPPFSSSAYNEMAQKQNNLQRDMGKMMDQLNKLSQKTFSISPEMGKALGKAQSNMMQSTNSLQNRNAFQAQNQQSQAMSSLNEAATLMKGSMESMLNGNGSGGGMMSLMQQLQKMSQQQMGLNNMTQQTQQGKLSMQQQAQFQRLAQQQELIRKSLDQLNKESKLSGDSKKIPANLDNIAKEMQEVVSDLRNQDLNDDVIQKQERILSRLLDAQRSINDRDYEKTRESNAGKNVVQKSPGDINYSSQNRRNRIKDELIKAVQEGYSKDYEVLIRKYYEALQKEDVKN